MPASSASSGENNMDEPTVKQVGYRQLRRTVPLETQELETPEGTLIIHTLEELLRVKAFPAYERNYTRDFVDFAELSCLLEPERVVEVLSVLDEKFQWEKQPSVILEVPDAVIVNVFVAAAAQRVQRRCLREIAFPVILIKQSVAPRGFFALRERDETLAGHIFRRLQTGGFEDGRRDVNVGDNQFDDRAAFEKLRALHQHRHAHGFLFSPRA
jgi:hypothetical protein